VADYPAALPVLTDEVGGAADPLDAPSLPAWATHISQEVEALAAELGTHPSAAFATVTARLDNVDTELADRDALGSAAAAQAAAIAAASSDATTKANAAQAAAIQRPNHTGTQLAATIADFAAAAIDAVEGTYVGQEQSQLRPNYPYFRGGLAPRQDLHEVVEDFETISGWFGTTPTADTTYKLSGSQGGRLTSTNGTQVTARHPIGIASMVAKHLEATFYVHDYTKLAASSGVKIGLYKNNASTSGYEWRFTPTRNGWHRVGLCLGDADAVAVSSPGALIDFVPVITDVVLRVTSAAGQTGIVTFDQVLAVESPLPHGTVIVNFDDARMSIFENALPIMQKYGIPGTLYLATDGLVTAPDGNPAMVEQDIATLHRLGWAIGGHSHTHPDLTTITVDEIRDEMRQSYEWLAERGYPPRTMAYPFGASDATVAAEAERWFELNRGLGGWIFPMPFYGYGNRQERFRLPCGTMSSANLQTAKDMVDFAAYMRQSAIMYCHSVGTGTYYAGTEITTAEFEELMAHIAAADVEPITANDLITSGLISSDPVRLVNLETDFATAETKLATIETGATADMSGAEILAALLPVDGAGSALDADTLRGTTPSAFALTVLDDADAATARATLGAAASADPSTWGFPYTVPPHLTRGTDSSPVPAANGGIYLRCLGGGTISKIGLRVVTSSGNISVAAYQNSGTGRAAVPGTRLATSGAVACPVAGYAEISLGATITVAPGDWLFLSADNTTAAFGSGLVNAVDTDLALGVAFRQGTAHPAPSPVGSLVALIGRPIVLVGVA
jgi:peptidoglycan/xylan/chitin deacetylase (PgdA/CDA1 family)